MGMKFKLPEIVLLLLLTGATVSGCAGATTTVVEKSAAPTPASNASASSAPSESTPTPSSPAPVKPLIFHGSGQQDLGTITVPSDSTISWSCPTCGNTNFIINNAQSDGNQIPTNGLDQTQGVDPLPAGVYHTVVVDTTGGSWTVAIGLGAAPTPSSTPSVSATAAPSSQASSPAQGAAVQCDANISVSGAADCSFAENTFYEYWAHHGATTFSVYSRSARALSTVSCAAGSDIVCTTDHGATVTFSQSAIDAYTQSEATAYANSGKLGP